MVMDEVDNYMSGTEVPDLLHFWQGKSNAWPSLTTVQSTY